MCQGSKRNNNSCCGEPPHLSEKELLQKLREHKKDLESELILVDKNLDQRLSPRKEVTDHDRHEREKRNSRES